MTHLRTFIIGLSVVLSVIPLTSQAASNTLSCSMSVYTPRGQVDIRDGDKVLVKEGEAISVSWTSKNATKATDQDKMVVGLSGSRTLTISDSKTLLYRFTNKSKKVNCSVRLSVVDGTIDSSSLLTSSSKPNLRGTVTGTNTVRVVVTDQEEKKLFTSKDVKVKKGKWEVKLSKELSSGSYTVTLYGAKDLKLNAIATGILSVFDKGSAKPSAGSISVSQVPLLMGGTAAPGSAVPVSYIKVINTGSTNVSIQGFHLLENGSAPDEVVIGFVTSDDKGGSRATIGGTEGTKEFKSGTAFVPLEATLVPGQIRIFTIKAIVSKTAGASAGKQLMIDIASADTTAAVKGIFPIRGTTFTLSR